MSGGTIMKAVIYFSTTKRQNSLKIAKTYDGDLFEIDFSDKKIKNYFLQMIVYGFRQYSRKKVKVIAPSIEFEKYDEVVLIAPTWAGTAAVYMQEYLRTVPFTNKKVRIIGTCGSSYRNFFIDMRKLLDDSNEIIEEKMLTHKDIT